MNARTLNQVAWRGSNRKAVVLTRTSKLRLKEAQLAQHCVVLLNASLSFFGWFCGPWRVVGLFSSSRQVAATAREEGGAFLEPRFSIYGRSRDEWAQFARWVRRWRVDAIPGVLLAVQVCRRRSSCRIGRIGF